MKSQNTLADTAARSVSELPATGFLRLKQIIGDRKSEPPIAPLLPISSTQWWEGVRTGRYPAPIKLGEATTVWRAEEIRSLIDEISSRERSDNSRGSRLTAVRRARRGRSS
jgi:prophage regulatory protein